MNQDSEKTESSQLQADKLRRKDYELFHDGELGRCPICGRLIMLPCLACTLPEKEEEIQVCGDELKTELYGAEQERYQRIRAYRDRYGISLFEDELFVERSYGVFHRS